MSSVTEQKPGESSLGHMPNDRWTFDQSVTAVFSDMLTRSIPQYEVMRQCVFDLGTHWVQPGTAIVDLGCSRGDALAPFVSKFQQQNTYFGAEISKPMLTAAKDRFYNEIARGFVNIAELDLRTGYPRVAASLTLCILTLQFTPLEHRQRILYDAYLNTVEGGAFMLVEKILGSSAGINNTMVNLYHERKRAAGYSTEEIERKKMALEGVLVPITARWNEELLGSAGFRQVDCFWRWMNFSGWIAIK